MLWLKALLTIITLATFDAELRFRTLAAKGNRKRALRLLDKLDEKNGK